MLFLRLHDDLSPEFRANHSWKWLVIARASGRFRERAMTAVGRRRSSVASVASCGIGMQRQPARIRIPCESRSKRDATGFASAAFAQLKSAAKSGHAH
jgi:hypothetical protein